MIDTTRHFSDPSRYSSCAPDRLWDEDEDAREWDELPEITDPAPVVSSCAESIRLLEEVAA